MKPEYILMTGAPGSKWSSVFKNIYWSKDLNQSDYSEDRLYYHDADTPGHPQLMHIGAYWDPGMEFEPDNWDGPFTEIPNKTKIIKSHVFANDLDRLKELGYPIVLVYRDDEKCLDWWKMCGEFNITYPKYNNYYHNLQCMKDHIIIQNHNITKFITENIDRVTKVTNNIQLCKELNIAEPDVLIGQNKVIHSYDEKDIKVYIYK